MNKVARYLTLLSVVLLFAVTSGSTQVTWTIKGGGGTSWIIHPKVFIVDPADADNVWQIAPATNSGTFYIAGEAIMKISEHWLFIPELNFNYTSGEINVTSLLQQTSARRLQNYTRLEIPLLLGVKSSDNFWFTFGPSIFFTTSDNKGFEKAVEELTSVAQINSTRNVGIKARIGAGMALSDRLLLEIKFDYDFGRKFEFVDGTYEVRMDMQSITAGLGWALNK
jgi:opacity protein-like surface antigen